MDSINWVIQLFEYEQLSTLIKWIEKMRQIICEYASEIFALVAVWRPEIPLSCTLS